MGLDLTYLAGKDLLTHYLARVDGAFGASYWSDEELLNGDRDIEAASLRHYGLLFSTPWADERFQRILRDPDALDPTFENSSINCIQTA